MALESSHTEIQKDNMKEALIIFDDGFFLHVGAEVFNENELVSDASGRASHMANFLRYVAFSIQYSMFYGRVTLAVLY